MLKALICCLVLLPRQGWTPSDGDRVVVLGGALLEQEIRTAHWETEVTRRLPKRAVVWRNLAWSGDTVRGEARAVFGTPNDGFNALVKETLRLKPTVIYFGYGLNESFAGEKGLPEFRKDYERLIQALAPTKARMGFMTVPLMVRVSSLLPDPAKQNRNIQAYNRVIREIASEKGGLLVELENLLDGLNSQEDSPNGMHLTATGYEKTAGRFAKALGLGEDGPWEVAVQPGKAEVVSGPLQTAVDNDKLVVSSPAIPAPGKGLKVRLKGLAAGTWEIRGPAGFAQTVVVEGESPVTVEIPVDAAAYQTVRRLVSDKDMLFFHRWRPQNETYLFGFRKHEQGNNAREIPLFDPLVEEAEKKIAATTGYSAEITWKAKTGAN